MLRKIGIPSILVTGTDTGVGKTLVACALLRRLAAEGASTAGMKPVAAGCEETPAGRTNEDVEALIAASTVRADRALVNPYALREAIAPHIAAAHESVRIDLQHLAACYVRLARRAHWVVVEGVGGFRVPLNDSEDSADLARMLALPVVLVVGMRLGCLSHAMLTREAIRSRGLRLAGWVANRIDPAMARGDENVEFLKRALDGPFLGEIPHVERADRRLQAAINVISFPV